MNNVLDNFKSALSSDKRIKYLLIAGCAAVLLILFSEFIPSSTEAKTVRIDYAEYTQSLENKTQELISSIKGVGRCRVMIMLKNSSENVFAKNTEQNGSESSNSYSSEYVLYNGNNGEEPVLIKEYFPSVQGVAVVCDGADNAAVRESVINCVSSLFNISVSKISVSEYKG